MDSRIAELEKLSALQAPHYQDLLRSVATDLHILQAYRVHWRSDLEGGEYSLEDLEGRMVELADKLVKDAPELTG